MEPLVPHPDDDREQIAAAEPGPGAPEPAPGFGHPGEEPDRADAEPDAARDPGRVDTPFRTPDPGA